MPLEAQFWYPFQEGKHIVGWHNPFTQETVRLDHRGNFLEPPLRTRTPGEAVDTPVLAITVKGEPRQVCYTVQGRADLSVFDRELMHKVRQHTYFSNRFETDCTKLPTDDSCNREGCVLLESETMTDKARQLVPFLSSSGKTCMELEPVCQREEELGLGGFRNIFKNQSNLRTLEERCDLKGLVARQRMWRYGIGAAAAGAGAAAYTYMTRARGERPAAPNENAPAATRWDALA